MLGMEILFLQFSMDMEVKINEICIGAETSDYVSKVFAKILVNEPAYKKKDYIKALDESFRKMDEAIESP